ncbi:MarR family winged helix-turn-helix transcriptional regulator [Catellatospora vulcania]|uniref:MarR family winged helix-turn-helix transcriptional regulator n=1 Tax=Catellatospora vulcania TaxID=1460450 RepID=UPI0012D4ABBB|nr:MarR family winged helix-turn-helix transcriptional regulator [Catellatospora vulcania]
MQPDGRGSVAFLLAQLGAHAAALFTERVAVLNLTPAQAGLLRLITVMPGRSQQTYAERLGVPPSRFVNLVDELESRDLVERRRGEPDRRSYALHLTTQGQAAMRDIGALGRAHEDDLCTDLTADERQTLRELLARIAEQQGLLPGVHPGYRRG